jgi:hypothetical protein
MEELKRKRIYFYSDWRKQILNLDGKETMNESKNFLLNLCNHCDNLNIKLGSEREELIWNGIETLLKYNKEKYDRRIITSKENGKLGGRPSNNLNNLNKPNKPDTGIDIDIDTGTETEKETEKEKISDGAGPYKAMPDKETSTEKTGNGPIGPLVEDPDEIFVDEETRNKFRKHKLFEKYQLENQHKYNTFKIIFNIPEKETFKIHSELYTEWMLDQFIKNRKKKAQTAELSSNVKNS